MWFTVIEYLDAGMVLKPHSCPDPNRSRPVAKRNAGVQTVEWSIGTQFPHWARVPSEGLGVKVLQKLNDLSWL